MSVNISIIMWLNEIMGVNCTEWNYSCAGYKASIDIRAAHVWGRRAWQFYLLQKIYAISGEIFLLFWKGSFNIFMIQKVVLVEQNFWCKADIFSNLKSEIHSQLPSFQCLNWLPWIIYVHIYFPYLNYRLSLGEGVI